MGNKVHEFDLHIEVGTSWYCGDVSITCEVTFPSPSGQKPITIDYDTGHDDSLEDAIQRATKDITAYMHDPDAWEWDYIAHSSEDWRKLKQEESYINDYRKKIAYAQKSIASDQKYLAEHEAQAALLRQKLEEAQS